MGLGQRLVGVEAEEAKTHRRGLGFEPMHNAARDSQAARRRRGPHPLDLGGRRVDALQRAAADRFALEARQDQQARRRLKVLDRRREIGRRVVSPLETLGEFAEIAFQAPARLGAGRRFDRDRDGALRKKALLLAHRRDKPGAPDRKSMAPILVRCRRRASLGREQ